MISRGKGVNCFKNKLNMNLSNEQTRIGSPSESHPVMLKQKQPEELNSNKIQKQNSRKFSTCSIEEESEPTKLIFPKFSRQFSTLRNLSSLTNCNFNGPKAFNSFTELAANVNYSPQFQTPKIKTQQGFVRPAAKRLANFNKEVISNYSFTNCFFESNNNGVNFNTFSIVKPEINQSSINKTNLLKSQFKNPFHSSQFSNEIFTPAKFKIENNLNSNKLGFSTVNIKRSSANCSTKKFISFTQKINSNNNNNFDRNKNLSLVSKKNSENKLIKPKTKRIKKIKKFKNENFYQFVKQSIRKIKLKKKGEKLKIANNSNILHIPGFYLNEENLICRKEFTQSIYNKINPINIGIKFDILLLLFF